MHACRTRTGGRMSASHACMHEGASEFLCCASFQEDRYCVAFFEGTSGCYNKSDSSFRFL